jgi:hypothetical protein
LRAEDLALRNKRCLVDLSPEMNMPISYHIDRTRNLIYSTGAGWLSEEEILDLQQRAQRDPDFSPTFYQLHDLRAASFNVSYAGIEQLARTALPKPGSRIAIVVDSTLGFGLARMFESMRFESGEDIGVFREINDARTWLELD